MSTVIDGVIKEWGDWLFYGAIEGRQSRNIQGGLVKLPKAKAVSKNPRKCLIATIRKVPEVMVKISGGGKNIARIKAHLDYISRNGKVELENERGNIYCGKDDIREIQDDWQNEGYRIHKNGSSKREAFNIVLSMPPGTDRESVAHAARTFAADLFENHQYVFASHDDEAHPHVHLTVKAVNRDGMRLNPRKADLQRWREIFAEKMREQGIEANATPRRVRGIVQKPEKQAIRHIDNGYEKGKRKEPSRAKEGQRKDAQYEIERGVKRENPAQERIITVREDVQNVYGQIARSLARGEAEDRFLALEITKFVRDLPPLLTKHQAFVQAIKYDRAKKAAKTLNLFKRLEQDGARGHERSR